MALAITTESANAADDFQLLGQCLWEAAMRAECVLKVDAMQGTFERQVRHDTLLLLELPQAAASQQPKSQRKTRPDGQARTSH